MKTPKTRRRAKPDICVRFGRAIQQRRAELGLTQEALAARAGINRTYIGDIERGARNVALRNLQKIVAALDLSVAEFFTRYTIEE